MSQDIEEQADVRDNLEMVHAIAKTLHQIDFPGADWEGLITHRHYLKDASLVALTINKVQRRQRRHALEIIKAARSARSEHLRKPGTSAAFRQEGELNMLNHVIDLLEGGSLLEDWLDKHGRCGSS